MVYEFSRVAENMEKGGIKPVVVFTKVAGPKAGEELVIDAGDFMIGNYPEWQAPPAERIPDHQVARAASEVAYKYSTKDLF